jgi:hypothetical protein
MAYLLLIIVVPLIAYTVWSIRQVREPWFDDAPRHAWATARASSADGVLVRLEADVTFRITQAGVRSPEDEASVLAEEALRRAIVTSRVLTLPGTGDEVPLGDDAHRPGMEVDSVVVTAADVEITRELRRLVGGP